MSNPDVNIRPNMVSGLEVNKDGATTNLVPSTINVIFSSSGFSDNDTVFEVLGES